MPSISTSTRKRLARARRLREREKGLQTPVHYNNLRYRFDASLRILGVGEHHDRISIETGLRPSYVHRAGDPRSKWFAKLGVWPEDAWRLDSPLGEGALLEEHLRWLWTTVAPHKAYFKALIEKASWASVCLGCLSTTPFPFWTVSASSLEITRELNLGLSFNFTLT